MLAVEHATIAIHGMPVVRDVSLQVGPRQIVGLVGPNGAGKTSLARAIAGFLKMESGTVRLRRDGLWERIDTLSPWAIARRGIVYVPEEKGVFDGLTVVDNLMVAFSTSTISKDRVLSLLHEVYGYFPFLRHKLQQRAGTLSGGEKKMLSLARALLFTMAEQKQRCEGSRLLILDEPTHGLHHSARDSISEIVRGIRERGIAVLILEQIFRFAEELADQCWMMENGVLKGELH